MPLEDEEDLLEFEGRRLERGFGLKVADGLGIADARDDVLALCVHQEIAVELTLAVGWIARERHAGSGRVTLVSERHGLNVHGCSEVIGDSVLLTIDAGALVHPAAEDGADSEVELNAGVHGEFGSARGADEFRVLGRGDLPREDRLEIIHDGLEVRCGEFGIGADSRNKAGFGEYVLKEVGTDTEHDVREHLDKATVGVPSETRVLGLGRKALGGIVVETEVEDGVHHAGHGEGSARAHRDEQRIAGVAERFAATLLEVGHGGVDLFQCAFGPCVVKGRVLDAGLAGNGEAARDRKSDPAHFGKIRSFSAEHEVHARRAFRHIMAAVIASEPIDALLFTHGPTPFPV